MQSFSQKILFALLIVMLPVGACNCNTTDATQKKTQEEVTPKAETPDEPVDPELEALVQNTALYPGFRFDALELSERRTFVRVAQAELCPCPDSTLSLHECMQDPDARCALALEASGVIGASIKERLSQSNILDRLADYLENARTVHEFELDDAPGKGAESPAVVVVEFADFLCPHCRYASEELAKILKEHPEDMRVYFKHYPLSDDGPNMAAAVASMAAHRQGQFWPMHDLIFQNQRDITPERLLRFAQQVGLNIERFQADMRNPEVRQQIQADRAEGMRVQITATPTIFINGRRFVGERHQLEAAIVNAIETSTTN